MSQKTLVSIALSLWSAGVIFVTPSAKADTPLTKAVVQDLRNQVRLLLKNQSPRPARRADLMTPGDALSTARNSMAELRFNDNSLARVGQQAVFQFLPNTRNFRLSNGTVLLLIPPGQGRTNIRTPNAAAGIRGSALFVRYIPETNTTLVGALTNSQIEVTNDGSTQGRVLQAGQIAVVVEDRLQAVYNFDLDTFYKTSEIVRDLDLPLKDAPSADPAIAAVQQETSEALKASTPLVGAGIVENPSFLQVASAPNTSSSTNPVFERETTQRLYPVSASGQRLDVEGQPVASQSGVPVENSSGAPLSNSHFANPTLPKASEVPSAGVAIASTPAVETRPTVPLTPTPVQPERPTVPVVEQPVIPTPPSGGNTPIATPPVQLERPTVPVVEQPVIPVVERPTVPVVEQPVAASTPVTPIVERPTVPVLEQPVVPSTPVAPIVERPTVPVVEQPITPVVERPTTPVISISTPAITSPTLPASNTPTTPITSVITPVQQTVPQLNQVIQITPSPSATVTIPTSVQAQPPVSQPVTTPPVVETSVETPVGSVGVTVSTPAN